jgi:hypothetical protein
MPVLPTPTGGSPLPNLTSPGQTTRAQAVANYVQFLTSRYGSPAGASYQHYADTHPRETANAALNAWAGVEAASLGPGLAGAIRQMEDAQAKITNQFGTGTAKGLGSLYPSWSLVFSGISGWFFRGLKVLFGGILVIIGVSRLTGIDNKVVQLATKVPGAALL